MVDGGADPHPLSRLGVWGRLLEAAKKARGVELGMTFLDGTNIRAHHEAAGAQKRGTTRGSETAVRRLAEAVEGLAPRPS